ncbi:MAG: hypothetical protein MUQ10_09080 [Anaerolineae bacterium]|nr:hypothetical protein [Anaerolineae bacterium]
MLGKFTQTIVIPGTLGAAVSFVATVPSPCTIQHLSMNQSNAGNARVKIGTTSDDNAYLDYTEAGQTNVPVVLSALSDWIGSVRPHLAKDEVFALQVDHDGDGGTAGADLTIVITFTEG